MAATSSEQMGRPTALAVLAALAVGLAVFYYFTGADNALPTRLVPHLQTVPLALDSVAAGPVRLPLQVNSFVVSLTHDVAGPFVQPVAAACFLSLLAVLLAGWVAVASTLTRTAFGLSMAPVIFLLMSLNAEALGVFGTTSRGVLYVLLAAVGGTGFALQAFGGRVPLAWRALLTGAVVAGLGGLLFVGGQLPAEETVLHLAAHATPAGAVLVALVVLWVGIENIRALLWFNTQAEQPASRFGLLPFLAASLFYLGILFLYYWNNGVLPLWPGVNFEPLVLLLPAVLAGGLGLRHRAPSYAPWMPYARGAAQLYPLAVAGAAGALAYTFATANAPLVDATREFTAQALLLLGGAFTFYILTNFAPLIKKRLRVYRVVFDPRRLPFYTVYIMGVAGLAILQSRQGVAWPNQVLAAQYNHLGDLTRLQSEAKPNDLALAVLAERYYAESGDVLYRSNLNAQMGRAALFRFREQRQNEINALVRGLQRGPNEKVSVRLAGLYDAPQDLFQGLEILRQGLQAQPGAAGLAGDLAQRFTQTSLTDSVAYYLDVAERLAPGSYASRTNQLAFLLKQGLLTQAEKLSSGFGSNPQEPALASNLTLLRLQQHQATTPAAAAKTDEAAKAEMEADRNLNDATFARLYHAALAAAQRGNAALLPALVLLSNRPSNEAYYEQLIFLQALTRHAVGQERAARQLLGPLTVGTSPTARYYQHLLGLWQLQQGQYVTAADQLDQAAVADSGTRAALRAWARQGGSATPRAGAPMPVGAAWLKQAQQAENQRDTAGAAKLYRRIVREAPFNEPAVLAAARYHSRRNPTAAYDALRSGLEENPRSVQLLQAYALAAADAGLGDYAADALAKLREQIPPGEYVTFAASYAAHQTARAAAAATFSAAPPPMLP